MPALTSAFEAPFQRAKLSRYDARRALGATMRRRKFLGVLGSAVAWPVAALAQQSKRIAILMLGAEEDSEWRARVTAFQAELARRGWTVGRNVSLDIRWRVADPERAKAEAVDALRLHPDVLLANSVSAARAAQQATQTVPVVFTAVSEPIGLGLVASLARPAGNITGFSNLEPSVGSKWLELLKEVAPGTKRVTFMFNPSSTRIAPQFYQAIEAAAPKFAVETSSSEVRDRAQIETALTTLGGQSNGGLICPPDTFLAFHHKFVADLTTQFRVPSIYPFKYYAADGGLMTYGPDQIDQFKQAAGYVDRILRGEKPGDLPVQQPSKFELVLNLRTARAIGIEVPLQLQQRADEVIE